MHKALGFILSPGKKGKKPKALPMKQGTLLLSADKPVVKCYLPQCVGGKVNVKELQLSSKSIPWAALQLEYFLDVPVIETRGPDLYILTLISH
jgi:hypothetical protein